MKAEMHAARRTGVAWAIVTALACLVMSADAQAARPPNIVFIMADDLGWKDVGCSGNSFVETPHLDQLARDGMRFTQACQQTVCSPTRAALLTGMHPVRTGITNYLGPEAGAKFLDPEVVTINERLKEAGYVSGLIGKWHLTGNYQAAKGSPDKHGWDEVIASETDYIGGGDYFHPYKHIADLPARMGDNEYLTDRLSLEACDFITRHHAKPFFLYLSHYAVHTALAAKPGLLAKYQEKLQRMPPGAAAKVGMKPALAAMMESVDEGVGRIMAVLKEAGVLENTLVVFTSDNGGESVRGVKGGGLASGVTSVAPLRAGKSHLYEGGLRVPLIVSWPQVTPPGSVCDVPFNGLDWYPTLLAVAGLQPRGPQPMDGTGIIGLLHNPAEARTVPMFWHYPLEKPHFLGGRSAAAMRQGNWKLIQFFDTATFELYDLGKDEREQHNLAEENPAKLEEMQRALIGWQSSMHAEVPNTWRFIENNRLKLGVDLGSGAAIGWLSSSAAPEKNVINHYDRGRFIQQSYYGDEDGSDWNGKPWRFNAVQGGDWRGLPGRVVEFRRESPTRLYTKTIPRHWATGKLLDDVAMEQWIAIEDDLAHVKHRMKYTGSMTHRPHHQELPAMFAQPEFDTLVYCEGDPWKNRPLARKHPGSENEYITMGEPWLAWENAHGEALGLLTRKVKRATCYRRESKAGCSYAAPIGTFALTPGLVVENELWIGVGTVEQLRHDFARLVRH